MMYRNVITFVTPDFILRRIAARMMDMAIVIDVPGMDPDDPAADASGLGVPGHVIADLECLPQYGASSAKIFHFSVSL
jgi:hypothetical protein